MAVLLVVPVAQPTTVQPGTEGWRFIDANEYYLTGQVWSIMKIRENWHSPPFQKAVRSNSSAKCKEKYVE
jgi:hypothetical protein